MNVNWQAGDRAGVPRRPTKDAYIYYNSKLDGARRRKEAEAKAQQPQQLDRQSKEGVVATVARGQASRPAQVDAAISRSLPAPPRRTGHRIEKIK